MIYFNSEKKSLLLALLNSKRLEISPKNGWRSRVVGEPMTSFPNWRRVWDSDPRGIAPACFPSMCHTIRRILLKINPPFWRGYVKDLTRALNCPPRSYSFLNFSKLLAAGENSITDLEYFPVPAKASCKHSFRVSLVLNS